MERSDETVFALASAGVFSQTYHSDAESEQRDSGDDSIRAPPLPIPNREVKPYHADGTAKAGE